MGATIFEERRAKNFLEISRNDQKHQSRDVKTQEKHAGSILKKAKLRLQ